MKIGFEDRVWDFDLDRVTLKQAMAIQLHTGKSISEWEDSLDLPEGGAGPGADWLASLACVYWLMHNQGGDVFPVADADFELAPFLEAFTAGMEAELAARKAAAPLAAEPDPTVPAGSRTAGRTSPASGTPKATTRPRPGPAREGAATGS